MSATSQSVVGSKTLVPFKRDLQERRRELMDVIEKLRHDIRILGDSGPRDVIEELCSTSSAEAVFATYTQSRTQLRKVEAALQRIASGDFGVCATCGEVIELKRLNALPWVSTCIQCQAGFEQSSVY